MKNLTVFIVVIVIALLNTPIESKGKKKTAPEAVPHESFECYVCNDCPTVSVNTTSKVCKPTINGVNHTCLTYMERITFMKRRRPLVIRGCSSERGTCADIEGIDSVHKDVIELVGCMECSTKNCNTNSGVNGLHSNFTTIYFMIAIIIPVYFFFCNVVYPQLSPQSYHVTLFHA